MNRNYFHYSCYIPIYVYKYLNKKVAKIMSNNVSLSAQMGTYVELGKVSNVFKL